MFKTIAAAGAAAFLTTACASLPAADDPREATTVHVSSRHANDVDVAVACGEGRPEYLGRVPELGDGDFEISPETTHCVWGLRFVLVPEGHPRGYVTERIHVRQGGHVEFQIEKYPALSAWHSR